MLFSTFSKSTYACVSCADLSVSCIYIYQEDLFVLCVHSWAFICTKFMCLFAYILFVYNIGRGGSQYGKYGLIRGYIGNVKFSFFLLHILCTEKTA